MIFVLKDYEFDADRSMATFRYGFDGYPHVFEESMQFSPGTARYNAEALKRSLFLAFCIVGTSYYKTFAGSDVRLEAGAIDDWQATFLSTVYQEGLSQYAFENDLTRDSLAHFTATAERTAAPVSYSGDGILSLQSGGKDSLLVASLLEAKKIAYTPWYVTQGTGHPAILDTLHSPLHVARRTIDRSGLQEAAVTGAKNGHIPVTYVMMSYALIQAILLGNDTIVAAIGHEGEEAHAWIGDLPVNHQWSKTWQAEQLFAEYVQRYISPDLKIGSPLRGLSELSIAELFADRAWERFGSSFSSCNVANYQQGANNAVLKWCGHCPKCANSYLLFAPFIARDTLQERLGGELFMHADLTETFQGLLDIEGVMKPFECVGEVDELRSAYHLAKVRGYESLPFDVPLSEFDRNIRYPAQDWASQLLDL